VATGASLALEGGAPTLKALRTRLHLHHSLSDNCWRQGPGQLLGGLPKDEVEACFCPASTGQGGGGDAACYRLNPSAGRVFEGPGWTDVLAVPYADLPVPMPITTSVSVARRRTLGQLQRRCRSIQLRRHEVSAVGRRYSRHAVDRSAPTVPHRFRVGHLGPVARRRMCCNNGSRRAALTAILVGGLLPWYLPAA
jgi:hypothetical protein